MLREVTDNGICVTATPCGIILIAITNDTDWRSAMPRQPSQASEGNRTRQSGIWEAAATAGIDPNSDIGDSELLLRKMDH